LSIHTPASFLTDLPVPQINEFVKRARQAKIHAYIIGQLKKHMPAMMGKNKAQKKLTDNLEDEFAKVRQLIQNAIWDTSHSNLMSLNSYTVAVYWCHP
jgi:hypothetical protein